MHFLGVMVAAVGEREKFLPLWNLTFQKKIQEIFLQTFALNFTMLIWLSETKSFTLFLLIHITNQEFHIF